MDGIELYKGDCLQVMQELIDKGIKVDMILTDPPYGTTACKWDSVIPYDAMWERLNKLIKPNGAVVLFGSEPFSSHLRMSNIKNYKYDWIWEKEQGANYLNANFQPLKVHEIIHIFGMMATSYSKLGNMVYIPQSLEVGKPYKNSGFKYNKDTQYSSIRSEIKEVKPKDNVNRRPRSIIKFNTDKRNSVHPTQKPVQLLEYLIKTYTNEGDTVLDFTMGSGSTGVACVNTNRKFIGIELDDKYFDIAEGRIKEAINNKQLTLF